MCAGVLLCEFYFKYPHFTPNCLFYICEVDLGLNSFIFLFMWADYLFKNIGLIYVWANLLCYTDFGLILFILSGIWVATHFLLRGFCLNLLSAFEMYMSAEFIWDLYGKLSTSAFFTSKFVNFSIIHTSIIWAVF